MNANMSMCTNMNMKMFELSYFIEPKSLENMALREIISVPLKVGFVSNYKNDRVKFSDVFRLVEIFNRKIELFYQKKVPKFQIIF